MHSAIDDFGLSSGADRKEMRNKRDNDERKVNTNG